jgi:hypothetical protein
MSLNQQIANLPDGYLNGSSHATRGGVVNSLTGSALIAGQLSTEIDVDHEMAAKLSKTSIGTLYGGRYKYVQTKAGSTAAPARGLIAFYATAADLKARIVTPDVPTNTGCVAGVYISAPTKGEFCWIQTSGLASVKFTDSITRATPAAQDMVFVKSADNVADQEEGATTVTVNLLARCLGIAAEAPVAGEIKLVELWERFRNV